MSIILSFSGQGSHYRGMGQNLYKRNSVFRKSINRSNEIVKRNLNRSIIDELYNTSNSKSFDDLLITHPSIIAVEIAMLEVIKELDILPDYVLGSSLGEFSAAVTAEIWSAEEAIQSSIMQAKVIVDSVNVGGMITVLNGSSDIVGSFYKDYGLFIISDDEDKQWTFVGMEKELDNFERVLDKSNTLFLRLPVKFPFHSPLIPEKDHRFDYYTSFTQPYNNPQISFVSGRYGTELFETPNSYFWDVITGPMNISKAIKYIEKKSAEPNLYIDMGPSGSIANSIGYYLDENSKSKTFKIMTPFKKEKEQLQELVKIINNEI